MTQTAAFMPWDRSVSVLRTANSKFCAHFGLTPPQRWRSHPFSFVISVFAKPKPNPVVSVLHTVIDVPQPQFYVQSNWHSIECHFEELPAVSPHNALMKKPTENSSSKQVRGTYGGLKATRSHSSISAQS